MERPHRMLCDVTLLRVKGRRLRAAELAPAVRGLLSVGTEQQSSFGQPLLRATLQELQAHTVAWRNVLVPLFDVRLIHLDESSLVLAGIELSSEVVDGKRRVSEHRQVWRCTPVTGPGQATQVSLD